MERVIPLRLVLIEELQEFVSTQKGLQPTTPVVNLCLEVID